MAQSAGEIHLRYLNHPDVEALALSEAEILAAVEGHHTHGRHEEPSQRVAAEHVLRGQGQPPAQQDERQEGVHERVGMVRHQQDRPAPGDLVQALDLDPSVEDVQPQACQRSQRSIKHLRVLLDTSAGFPLWN